VLHADQSLVDNDDDDDDDHNNDGEEDEEEEGEAWEIHRRKGHFVHIFLLLRVGFYLDFELLMSRRTGRQVNRGGNTIPTFVSLYFREEAGAFLRRFCFWGQTRFGTGGIWNLAWDLGGADMVGGRDDDIKGK
jgi:hypothetical protein